MKLHGKVISIFPKERVAKLQTLTQIYYLYFQRKDFKEFGPYFCCFQQKQTLVHLP